MKRTQEELLDFLGLKLGDTITISGGTIEYELWYDRHGEIKIMSINDSDKYRLAMIVDMEYEVVKPLIVDLLK